MPVVGVIGAGQLARMMQPAAIGLGVRLRVLAARADESAAQVIPDTVLGRHDDMAAVRAFARGCDVVTFDHEHVPAEILERVVQDGVPVRPGAGALVHAQDKAVMRERLSALGLPCPDWRRVKNAADVADFAKDTTGWPVILKATRGGYDGKGVWRVAGADQASLVVEGAVERGVELIAEQLMPFQRELSVVAVRGRDGEFRTWPLTENWHDHGILSASLAPATVDAAIAEKAIAHARAVAAQGAR